MKETWSRVESRYLKLMRERKQEQAAEMLKAEYAIARRGKDVEAAALIRSLLVSSLIASGQDDEAVEILREAQRGDESNVFRRLQLATQLVRLNRPAEALAELTPAAPKLLKMNETRHATLGLLGASHALAGRLDEALSSFRAILEPTLLARMEPAAFDFYLVEALLAVGKAPEECILYLTLVSERAKAVGDLIVARRAQELLAQVNP